MTALRKTWPAAAAAASGFLLSLGYAPWSIEGIAWVWMLPLLWALWFGRGTDSPSPGKRARFGALLGYVAGAVFFLINLSWLHTVSSLGAILLALYLAVYFSAWGAFAATAGRPRDTDLVPGIEPAVDSRTLAPRPNSSLFAGSLQNLKFAFLNAAAWTSLEWLRGTLFTGFGWNGLGVALHDNLMLIQIADIVGVTGLSFMLIFCGCIAAGTVRRVYVEFGNRAIRPHIDFGVTIIGVILVFLYGLRQSSRGYEDMVPLRSLILQLNIPISEKWDPAFAREIYEAYNEFTTLFTATGDFDLVLWPETALYKEFFTIDTQAFLNRLLGENDFHLVLGIEEGSPPDKFYNSVALLRGNTATYQMHRKVHLVPFGEYIPLRKAFPPFEWVAGRLVPIDFSRGEKYEPLVMNDPDLEIIPLVCFEDTLGGLVRRFVSSKTQLIVNVTNDGWFLESAGAIQHLANARFRCVELKRPMARAANSGVSCFIDHAGSLFNRAGEPQHSLSLFNYETRTLFSRSGSPPLRREILDPETGSHFVSGSLADTFMIPRNPPVTFYARFGDLFSKLMLGFTGALLILRIVRARRARR